MNTEESRRTTLGWVTILLKRVLYNVHTREHWSYNYQQLLNWHHEYGAHEVEAMLGHEYYRTRGYNIFGERQKPSQTKRSEMNQAILVIDTGSSMGDYNTEGWFGRAPVQL
ncbi:MAG: hypothetical protein ACLTGI_10235 [Hoylesella buccalis]